MDWDQIPDQAAIDRTMAGLKERNFNPVLVPDRKSALETLTKMIPPGSEVMTGSSTTLEEIGFIDLLISSRHPWRNWKDRILPEKDPQKQEDLRRLSTTAEYFIGSIQAVTETGQVLGTDASGSRQGGYVFGGKNVIWVIGVNKIVDEMHRAFNRLYEHCVPLEDARMKRAGFAGTTVGKIVIYERELLPKRITTILVREKLGF
ncbi:MAG: lactate utilization protein [Chloroflexi bacterium]|nr:lactate utilization protein [Chloroflexota bacterium]